MPRCKECRNKFEAKYFNQKFCLEKDECIKAHVEYAKEKQRKDWNKEKKVRKEKLKTRSEWLNDLQKVFNQYIRERDKGLPCVSCGRQIDKYNTHASHYFSVGAYPNLRFNEYNVHSSCDYCNLYLHGNIAEYSIRLPKRIGLDKFKNLKEARNGEPLKLTTEEIKHLIKKYKEKTRSIR